MIYRLEITDKDFKIALINMVKKMKEKAGTFSRTLGSINKNQIEISR